MQLLESSFVTPGPATMIWLRHGHYPTNDKTFGEWKPGDPLPDIPGLEEDAQIGLDDLGWEQAGRAGGFLFGQYPDIEVALSSDWRRAHETAGGVSAVYAAGRGRGLTIEHSSALYERNRGAYRGLPKAWLAEQGDYATYLEYPATWVPNPNGSDLDRGETLIHKAVVLRDMWPCMGKLALEKTLLITTHGEVAGGAALIAFAGFGDEELRQPLPGYGKEWMPRTVNNCQAYIFADLTERAGRFSYRNFMAVDASQPQIRTTDWIPINTPR